jgi:hypothetical protein
MKAYCLVEQIAGTPQFREDFDFFRPTGQRVTTHERERLEEEVDILDDDGNPTGETQMVFAGWGDRYEVEVDEIVGGWVLVGIDGDWGAYLLYGVMAAINAAVGFPEIINVSLKRNLGNPIVAANRNDVNDWLSARGYDEVAAGTLSRDAVAQVFSHFDPDFQLEKYDVGEDDANDEPS